MNKLVLNRLSALNIINVLGFVMFFFAKYYSYMFLLYLALFVFLINSSLSVYYLIKTKKDSLEVKDYNKVRIKFLIRVVFALFFFCYGVFLLGKY